MKKLGFLLVFFVLFFVACKKETISISTKHQSQTSVTDRYAVPLGDSVSIGPHNAVITIVNFSDFQCPFSQRAVPVIAQLMEKYPEKIRYVFKNFPLGFHKMASPAARAAIAARKQGKFWEMYRLIFHDNKNLTQEHLKSLAEKLHLNMEQFEEEMDAKESLDIINRDITLGHQFGVRGTPTLFINGKRMVGVKMSMVRETVLHDLKKAEKMKQNGITNFYAAFTKKGMTQFRQPKSIAPSIDKIIYAVNPPAETSSIGAVNSPVHVVAFIDYQCPHSRKVYTTLQELFVQKKGALLIQYMNLPLSYHKHAKLAAQAALVANKHAVFKLFSDKLFTTQHVWSSMDNDSFEKYLISIATTLKIDATLFTEELHSPAIMRHLRQQMESAKRLGVHTTPVSFINGRHIRGAYPLFSFMETYDEEIERAVIMKKTINDKDSLYSELIKNGKTRLLSPSATARKGLFADGGQIYTPQLRGDEIRLGKGDAPIKVILFIDYPCPYSRRTFMMLKQLQQEKEGVFTIFLKHLPLQSALHAQTIARYSLAVYAIYDEKQALNIVSTLFSKQQEMPQKNMQPFLKKITEDMQLDWTKIEKKMKSSEIDLILKKDVEEAQRLHVVGVPTLFINGKKIKGSHSLTWFRKAIEKSAKDLQINPQK